MNTLVDSPVVGVAIVVLASIVLFTPTIVAHFRKIHAFRSVSALNALTFLLAAGFAVPGLLSGGSWSPILWATAAVWGAAAIWSLAGSPRRMRK